MATLRPAAMHSPGIAAREGLRFAIPTLANHPAMMSVGVSSMAAASATATEASAAAASPAAAPKAACGTALPFVWQARGQASGHTQAQSASVRKAHHVEAHESEFGETSTSQRASCAHLRRNATAAAYADSGDDGRQVHATYAWANTLNVDAARQHTAAMALACLCWNSPPAALAAQVAYAPHPPSNGTFVVEEEVGWQHPQRARAFDSIVPPTDSALQDDDTSSAGVQYTAPAVFTSRSTSDSASAAVAVSHAVEIATVAAEDSVEGQIREAVRKVVTRAKAPGVLRLAFHDAGTYDLNTNTGGANGSILLELERPESNGLKRYTKVLKKAKKDLEASGVQVSWADLIAVAGAEAVEMSGGPHIAVQLGRPDALVADEEGRMPAETFDADQVFASFAGKGFSVRETVVLLGGHTLGGKGFGNPTVFDNSYFTVLLQRPWEAAGSSADASSLVAAAAGDHSSGMAMSAAMGSMIGLPSDRALLKSDDAVRWIETYAADQELFFDDFVAAYTKMVENGVQWAS